VSDDRTPILVGAGQLTQRDVDPDRALEPVAMMAVAAQAAAEDAGIGRALLQRIDSLAVVNLFSWPYANPPRLLAERLGVRPAKEITTTVGGNTPQWLVNETASRIADGRVRVALLAGAEAVRTVLRARKARVSLAWGGGEGTPAVVGDAKDGTSGHEVAHGLVLPIQIYPLFENALRARAGRSIPEHQRHLGRLCASLSAVAADNPHAWFRQARSADEITTVTPSNRMIGFPYPKLMNAVIEVDQAAAVLMTSVGEARALGIPQDRWAYLWGTGEAHDRWFVSDRVDYASSPAIREAGRQALDAAGIGIERVDHLDIYSCFPAAVQIGRDALGIPAGDPRPLTVTGGLPYFGGPGNNYSMHAIAQMMDRVRARPGSIGLVTALGWFITKHAVGVYGAQPKDGPFVREDPAPRQATLDAAPAPELAREPSGPASIETYTVLHDRDGAPVRGLVIGRLDDGRRFLAVTPDDRATLDGLMAEEGVGRRGRVGTRDGVGWFEPG
jgi:acetyl-CoA C-acetyltransferase